jgi:broad specificity phosphatase PhoE
MIPSLAATLVMLMSLSKNRVMSAATKDLYLLRHGQATHNPRAEAARAAGCSFDNFLELMRQDDSLDSELTALGREQARTVFETHSGNRHFRRIDLVVSSPLSRTMQTADLAVPLEIASNRVCVEDFREINGWLLNAQRKSLTDIRKTFPAWNLEHLEHEEDILWTPELESNESCAERGYQGLQWVLGRPEHKILVCAHGAILRYVMAEHSLVQVLDGRTSTAIKNNDSSETTDADGDANAPRTADARFDNCELRRYRIQWGSSEGDEKRIVLTEVDMDHEHVAVEEEEEEAKETMTSL